MKLEPGTYIWSTRGRNWGFEFLTNGGYADPLPHYERSFAGLMDQREACKQVGDTLALRFIDPEGRQDRSRRPIFHDFVIRLSGTNTEFELSDAASVAWNTVATDYAAIWDAENPPPLTTQR